VTTHIVKSWAHFFDAIKRGDKTHDLRKDDRNFQVGDVLRLERYDNVTGRYTEDAPCFVDVTYITNRQTPCAFSSSVLEPGYCILSIQLR
jgi:Domain of unknown function (DUF3850)